MAGWHSCGLWADTSETGSASESSLIYAAPRCISAISGSNAGYPMGLAVIRQKSAEELLERPGCQRVYANDHFATAIDDLQ